MRPEGRNPSNHYTQQRRRRYEGGDVIPVAAPDNAELLEKFRQKILEKKQAKDVYRPGRFTDLELGHIPSVEEPELPIRSHKEAFLDAVANNQVVIVVAETGAGKSTQIPQYLMERGYHVSMTQPRRISASFVAERIQEEVEAVLGDSMPYAEDLVGHHTAERNTTVKGFTRIEVVTDGLRLVQEYGERDELVDEVLIIDEAHEWNSNIEMLIARAYQLVSEKPHLRVVIMSATMEADKLARYFSKAVGGKVPIIEVEGRVHDIEVEELPGSTMVREAVDAAMRGEKVLMFFPGVSEIKQAMQDVGEELGDRARSVLMLPLYSELSEHEQDRVKMPYNGPMIIFATNVAETSITIPEVDLVIDSGLERLKEMDEQLNEGLELAYCSRDKLKQRKGRTGRNGPGKYILTRLNKETEFVGIDSNKRTEYTVPEILRTNVNRNTLLAAAKGLDFETLPLFHKVDRKVKLRAKQALMNLDAIDSEGIITPRGKRMVQFPMRPEYSRMIVEAEERKFTLREKAQMAAMLAVMETGGLTSWMDNASREWRNLYEDSESDFLAQLDVFIGSQQLSETESLVIGLSPRNKSRSRELYEKTARYMGIPPTQELASPTEDERKNLTLAITAGLVDFVYEQTKPGSQKHKAQYQSLTPEKDRYPRTISGRTTLNQSSPPPLIVGTPWRVEKFEKGVRKVDHVVQDVTATTIEALTEVAGHLMRWKGEKLFVRNGVVRKLSEQAFKGTVSTGVSRETAATYSPEAVQLMVKEMIQKSGQNLRALKELKKQLEDLQHFTQEPLPIIRQQDMIEMIQKSIDPNVLDVAYTDVRLGQLMQAQGISFENRISREQYDEIVRNAPLQVMYEGRVWKVSYQNGVPRMRIKTFAETEKWAQPPVLPDGRQIKLMYGQKQYYLNTLRRLEKAGKLTHLK